MKKRFAVALLLISTFSFAANIEKVAAVCGDSGSGLFHSNYIELRISFHRGEELILLDHLFEAANESTCSIYRAQLGRVLAGMDFHSFKESSFECRNDKDGTYRLYITKQNQTKKVFTFLGKSEDDVRSNCYEAENLIRKGQMNSALDK